MMTGGDISDENESLRLLELRGDVSFYFYTDLKIWIYSLCYIRSARMYVGMRFSMPKLPGFHVCLGLIAFGLSAMAKDNLPQNIGSLPMIQLPCAFFSSVMLPLGSLPALRKLVMGSGSRRKLVSYHLLGLLFVLVMLSVYFAKVIVMDKVMEIAQFPSMLPKLVENARSLPDRQKRTTAPRIARNEA